MDDVIDVYRRDVDRAMLRENLKLSVAERFEKFETMMAELHELRGSAAKPKPHESVVPKPD